VASPHDVRFDLFSDQNVTLAKRDAAINQIEDYLERKYLRYCDPSNSLHTFASIIIRSSICRMKLLAHNPRQFATSPVKVPSSERDIVFLNATKLLEYVIMIQKGHQGLEKYMWQIGTSHLWVTMLYVLIETRRRKTGPEVDKSWRLIGDVFSYYPKVFEESTGPVYTALGKWTLEVWDLYVAASRAEGLLEPLTPEYISVLRRCRIPAKEPQPGDKNLQTNSELTDNSVGHHKIRAQREEETIPTFDPFDSYEFPNLLSFETDPNEWIQWEQLIAEHGGFVQSGSL
jgi:hypothetical protein